jgi:hypothetical protein
LNREDLTKKTVAELRALAKAEGLTSFSRLRKGELIDALLEGRSPRSVRGNQAASASEGRGARRGSTRGKRASRAARKPAPAGDGAGEPAEEHEGSPLSPRTRRAFLASGSQGTRARRLAEQRIKASKYYLGVEESPELDEGFKYPETHGENIITLMVRDPYWLFTYWEFSPDIDSELAARIAEEDLEKSRIVLRVYDVTGTDLDNPVSYHDIDIARGARNWYINVMRVERDYCVDIGVITPDGTFIVIARSNRVSLPPVGPSEAVDEKWVTLEALTEHYEQSGGGPSSGSGGWGPDGRWY